MVSGMQLMVQVAVPFYARRPSRTHSSRETVRGPWGDVSVRFGVQHVRLSCAAGGESRAHDIASWLYPIDPSSRGGKGYHRYIKKIKKVGKQFVRAGRGTRPSREGRAEGGVR